jgi:hypothetical protein
MPPLRPQIIRASTSVIFAARFDYCVHIWNASVRINRSLIVAVCVAGLATGSYAVSSTITVAEEQAASPAVTQMALTKEQVEGVIAAQKEMDTIHERVADKPVPYLVVAEQLDSVAKKNGFASFDEYTNVVDNISAVLAGFDPLTKKYVGSEALIKLQIAHVQADKTMSVEEKKEAVHELNDALKSPALPVENMGNVELVSKYYDELADTLGTDRQ